MRDPGWQGKWVNGHGTQRQSVGTGSTNWLHPEALIQRIERRGGGQDLKRSHKPPEAGATPAPATNRV